MFSPGIFNLFICFELVINSGVYYHGYIGVLYFFEAVLIPMFIIVIL